MARFVFRLLAAVLLLAPVTVRAADEPTKPPVEKSSVEAPVNQEALAAANDLFRLLSKDMISELIEKVTTQTWPAMESSLRANNPDVEQAVLDDMRNEFEKIQKTYMADILRDAPEVYARNFSAEELRDVMTFYQTPTGRKMLQVTPQITAQILALITPRVQEVLARTRAAFAQSVKVRGFRI